MEFLDYVDGMELGRGYNSQSGKVHGGSAITFDGQGTTAQTGSRGSYELSLEESSTDIATVLGIDAAARVRGLLWQASAKVSLYQQRSISSYSARMMCRIFIEKETRHIQQVKLLPGLEQLWVDHQDQFINSFGTDYLGSVKTGGEYVACIEIMTNSSSDLQSLRASIKGGTKVFSGSAELESHIQAITSGRSLSIHVSYSGGKDADSKAEVTISEMMDRMRGFESELKKGNTYNIGFISYPYTDLNLPPLPSAAMAYRQTLLGGLTNDYERALRLEADLSYVLQFSDQFKDSDVALLEELKSEAFELQLQIRANAMRVYGAELKDVLKVKDELMPLPKVSELRKRIPERIKKYEKIVTVLAKNPAWTDTGMFVFSNQRIVFDANGVWSYGKQCDAWGGPKLADPPNAGMLLPGHNFGALICRIGNQEFTVGTHQEIRVQEPGTIYLACNDSRIGTGWDDNDGSLDVKIAVG